MIALFTISASFIKLAEKFNWERGAISQSLISLFPGTVITLFKKNPSELTDKTSTVENDIAHRIKDLQKHIYNCDLVR